MKIIEYSKGSITEVENVFKVVESGAQGPQGETGPAGTTIHNVTSGKQGGTTDEYYHLTEDQNGAAENASSPSSSNPFATTSDALDNDALLFMMRVVADGGTVEDVSFLDSFFKDAKANGYFNDIVAAYSPSWGIKGTTNASKLYSITGAATDVVQAVGAKQMSIESNSLNSKTRLGSDGTTQYFDTKAFTFAQPETVIMGGLQYSSHTNGDKFIDGIVNSDMAIRNSFNSGSLQIIAESGKSVTAEMTVGSDGCLAALFNGADSTLQINNDPSIVGDAGANDADGVTIGAGANTLNIAHSKFGTLTLLNSAVDTSYLAKRAALYDFNRSAYDTSCLDPCSSSWAGKSMLWLGTSIPAGGDPSYPKIIADRMFSYLTNNAVGSSHISLLDDAVGVNAPLSLSATQAEIIAHPWYAGGEEVNSYEVKVIGTDVDVIILDHGHNDRTPYVIGDINDTDRTTFYGGMNLVIAAAVADNPDVEIVFVTPPKKWFSGVENAEIVAIQQAIIALAAKYDKTLIDLIAGEVFKQATYGTYFPDDVHPNDDGRAIIADFIAPRLNNVII